MNPSDVRRYITKSKAGHYTLTLVHKPTKIKARGQQRHGSPAAAMSHEYPALLAELAERVAGKRLIDILD